MLPHGGPERGQVGDAPRVKIRVCCEGLVVCGVDVLEEGVKVGCLWGGVVPEFFRLGGVVHVVGFIIVVAGGGWSGVGHCELRGLRWGLKVTG